MAKFVTKHGSYTLVLKPEGREPTYNHKGIPVRVEGTIYAEFKNVKGTAVGMLDTQDTKLINALRQSERYGKTFTEIKNEKSFKEAMAAQQKTSMVKVPKSALMACTKNELTSIAKQYNLQLDDDMTKAVIIKMILEAQDNPQNQPVEAPAQVHIEGGIKKIIQEIVDKNEQIVKNQKERSIGPLMGMVMKELRGKASGEKINKILLENIQKKLEK